MKNNKKFMEDYSRGMDLLRMSNRAFSGLAAGLGYPIENPDIPTAQVQMNIDEARIEFHINPNFIANLSDYDIAAVVAHEAFHVILNHLSELAESDVYPDAQALQYAHECIINDGLPGNVGFETMKGSLKGLELFNQDFSLFSTKEGYDFIVNQKEYQDAKNGNSEGSEGNSEGSESGSASGSETSEGSGESSCGGIKIIAGPDGFTKDQVQQILASVISDTMDETDTQDLPSDVQQALEEMASELGTPRPGYSNAKQKEGFSSIDTISTMNMNWVKLLAEINPKMKNYGRSVYKDSWAAPRRRMLHSYPKVVLPTSNRIDTSKGRGSSIPTFVIALDMSKSIPTRLLKDLAALAESIPHDLIRAFPITWSDSFRVFDPKNPNQIVLRGGTRLQSVKDYAEIVEKETGSKPYVLVITDGEYEAPKNWNVEEIQNKWYWMAIQPNDVKEIVYNTGKYTKKERVFNLADFV